MPDDPQKDMLLLASIDVMQGTEADGVPIAQGREVFAASPAKQKTFVEVPGAHHSDLRVGHPPAGDAVATFLQQIATSQLLGTLAY